MTYVICRAVLAALAPCCAAAYQLDLVMVGLGADCNDGCMCSLLCKLSWEVHTAGGGSRPSTVPFLLYQLACSTFI